MEIIEEVYNLHLLVIKNKTAGICDKEKTFFQVLDKILCALIPTNLSENHQPPFLNLGIHIAYNFINNTYISLIISV